MKKTPKKTPRKRAETCVPNGLLELVLRIGPRGLRFKDIKNHLETSISDAALRALLRSLSALVVVDDDHVYPRRMSSFFGARQKLGTDAKRAVAMHIHRKMISSLESVFMDAGSACAAVAEEIASGEKGHLTVMTNNMAAVFALMKNNTVRIALTGGLYLREDEALVGEGALWNTSQFTVNVAIVGASGLTASRVYNHGTLGEELIKKAYWRTPAKELIVPALLQKFGGKDASCFGELCRDNRSVDEQADSVDSILGAAADDQRVKSWETRYKDPGNSHVPKFKADRCTIVVEPEWMAQELEKSIPQSRFTELMDIVAEIRMNSKRSNVYVEHAEVTRKEFERRSASRRRKG